MVQNDESDKAISETNMKNPLVLVQFNTTSSLTSVEVVSS